MLIILLLKCITIYIKKNIKIKKTDIEGKINERKKTKYFTKKNTKRISKILVKFQRKLIKSIYSNMKLRSKKSITNVCGYVRFSVRECKRETLFWAIKLHFTPELSLLYYSGYTMIISKYYKSNSSTL